MTPSRGVLVSRMLDVGQLFHSLMQVRPEGVTHANGKLANVCGFGGSTLMERMVTAAMIQIILSLCIFNWNLILTFRSLSSHSAITLISADDHGCLLLNPRVPVQVSLSENNFSFSSFPICPI